MIKKFVLESFMTFIKKNCPDYSNEKLAEIKYGLEALYLTITKMIILFIVTIFLGIFKETLIILLLYNLLRITGCGLHATKSWMCLVSTLIVFVLIPISAIYLKLSIITKILLCTICIISFCLYAPADTKKHPLIKKQKRDIYKYITIFIALIYTYISLYTDNNFISNSLIFSMIIEMGLILPFTYKIFKLPYRNYKSYRF